MKNLFFLFLIALFINSCEKVSENKISIKGHLYSDCNRQPLSNVLLQLYKPNTGAGQGGITILSEVTTAQDGSFQFDIISTLHQLTLRRDGSSGEIMYNIPGENTIENVEVFSPAKTIIEVRLNVQHPYTNQDTLYVTDYDNVYVKKKVAGPFATGVLYTSTNFTIPIPNYLNSDMDIGYKINNRDWVIKNFFLNPCQTNSVTVDINQ